MATVPERSLPPLSPWAGVEYGFHRELLDRLRALHDIIDYAIGGALSTEVAVDAVIRFTKSLELWERAA